MKTFNQFLYEINQNKFDTRTIDGVHKLLHHHITNMGLDINQSHGSSLSGSKYLHVSHVKSTDSDGYPKEVKNYNIRISDHTLPQTHKYTHGEADLEVSPSHIEHDDKNANWYHALNHLSHETGKPLPASAKRQITIETKARQEKAQKHEKYKQEIASAYRENVSKEIPHIKKFHEWISNLPHESKLKISNSNNISAHVNGEHHSTFGKKPEGYSSLHDNIEHAKKFINSKNMEHERAMKE